MQRRTKATAVKKKVRDKVLHRDKYCCVSCGSPHSLTMAHIFLSRAKGGLGIEENLATLCMECHHKLDNGRKHETQYVDSLVREYMVKMYNIESLEMLKYNKYR